MAVTLDNQPVRAEISIGNLGIIKTPDVVSFSVRRARNQMCATFQVSIKVDADELSSTKEILSEKIIIKAGLRGRLKTIFTGKIYNCIINPVRTDASKVMLNLVGKDVLSRLEGQKINRRIKTYRDGTTPPERIGYITGILRKNVPIRQRFPTKYYSPDPKAVLTWPDERIVKTADAYVSELNRNIPGETSGGIEYIIVERGGAPTGG
jgi:hypothetical protein